MKAVRVVVRGRVQGVGFRWSSRRAAERIGVAGWVRNRLDGAVEAHVEGPEDRVDSMLSWFEKGPDAAWVSTVEFEAATVEGLEGFAIR
ncbi:MAG TPA: acylphosphatase [Acidimicrobiia bacterium]|nr:acylphosphatase [Acidimicrobiia bacterium]